MSENIRTDNSHLGGYIYKFYIQDDDTIKKPSNYGNNNNPNNKDAIIASFDKKYGAIRSCCLNKKDEIFYGTSNGYVLKIDDKSLGRLDQDRDENTQWNFNTNILNNQPDYNISVVFCQVDLSKNLYIRIKIYLKIIQKTPDLVYMWNICHIQALVVYNLIIIINYT